MTINWRERLQPVYEACYDRTRSMADISRMIGDLQLEADKSSPKCTCDDVGTGPCPQHARENALQDEAITARNAAGDQLAKYRRALMHMQVCRSCADGDWRDCEQGREALELLKQDLPTLSKSPAAENDQT